jgi:hypothetical protein
MPLPKTEAAEGGVAAIDKPLEGLGIETFAVVLQGRARAFAALEEAKE